MPQTYLKRLIFPLPLLKNNHHCLQNPIKVKVIIIAEA